MSLCKQGLDPTRRSARVTREIADKLAKLARSLESQGYDPERVAAFLMRVIFTMFAEDVRLLPPTSFKRLLESIRGDAGHFKEIIEPLWQTMNTGGYSPGLRETLLRFNGGLFADSEALPVTEEQLELLIEASQADWREVEPAIFGTLLERALDPYERHKLGAHYTPRAYVERLVMPTVIEPLRNEWQGVQAAVMSHRLKGKPKLAEAELRTFHKRLCSLHILDPACGSGNFLYVTLEHLKRLEAEVLAALASLTENEQTSIDLEGVTVTPEQFSGLEVNPRAAKIAELVLWIGYLQWHFKTHGDVTPAEPIIRDFHNIENRDAILAYDGTETATGKDGKPLTRWDGYTFKTHPVTGEDVPDESARVQELRYLNPRKAEWPKADFVVGNPPFIGTSMMRQALGDGYTKAVRKLYKNVPDSADFVMFWWDKAADLLSAGKLEHFGFVSTNSIRQTFNRRVLQAHLKAKKPLSLTFAIPDHPWVDAGDGAAVRIAMTVAALGDREGVLKRVVEETPSGHGEYDVHFETQVGKIQADLTIGPDIAGALPLKANEDISSPGVKLHGSGFIVTPEEAAQLGLGRVPGLEHHIREYRNGRDLTAKPRGVMVIDLYGLTAEEVRERFPAVYQWVYERVKPEREGKVGSTQDSKQYAKDWWLFGKPRPVLRAALAGLNRYIATVETSKHRFFVFLDESILPDNKLVAIALEDAYFLGVLSSRVHVAWALASGGHLGVGNDPVYVKSSCFEKFPFPNASEEQKRRIRELGEALDAHRKRQQAAHPDLTLTGMYNVLEKLKAGEAPSDAERKIHEDGLVSILRELHDDLDSAVLEAYGWPLTLTDKDILTRLVTLNATRTAEEAQGVIRWLRPEYQDPEMKARASTLGLEIPAMPAAKLVQQPWPSSLPQQAQSLRNTITLLNQPLSAAELARTFKGARADRVSEVLDTLAALGQVRVLEDGRYAA